MKRKVLAVRVLRNGARETGTFDRDFWSRVDPTQRLEATWEMSAMLRQLKGLPGREPDFEDLLSNLSAARAEFLIVGAYAVSHHTEPRYTKDLGVWVRPNSVTARKVYRALREFGAPLKNLRVKDLHTPGIIFQIGIEPNRIDVLTELDGITFDSAWKRRVDARFARAKVPFLSVVDLVTNKSKVGRPQDLRRTKR